MLFLYKYSMDENIAIGRIQQAGTIGKRPASGLVGDGCTGSCIPIFILHSIVKSVF